MSTTTFDEHASKYDAWFMENLPVLDSEVALLALVLRGCGRTLSVGCGSGLFEMLLARDHGITVGDGIEPAEGMAGIARQRGMNVRLGTAEDSDYGDGEYDTVLFNGTPSYIAELPLALARAHKALKPGGHVILVDVPKESGYGLLYNLALALGTWDHPLLAGVQPKDPYPIEFVKAARWRTTAEKAGMLVEAGFTDLTFAQTLTRHPVFSNKGFEPPTEGHDRGDYVAIKARKA